MKGNLYMKKTNFLLMFFLISLVYVVNFGCKKDGPNGNDNNNGSELNIISTNEAYYDDYLYVEATFEDESKMYFRLIDDATAEVVNSEAFSDEPYMYRGEISVPSQFTHINHTYTVIGICGGAFGSREYSNTYLRKIHLPNTIEYLDGFRDCENLKEIDIPQSVREIRGGAFCSSGLTSELVIPNSVTTIGMRAFENTHITALTLGNSLSTIRENAFRGCDLTEVFIPNSVTTVEDGAFGGFDVAGYDEINHCPIDYQIGFKIKSLTIGNSVTHIGSQAFSCNDSIIVTCLAEFPPSLDGFAFINEDWNYIQNGTLYIPSESFQYYLNSEWQYYFSKFRAIN